MNNKDNMLDDWGSFTSGTFLKALNVKSEQDPFVCTNVAINETKEGQTRLRLTLENNGLDYDFDLNMTNSNKLKELGVKRPKECIGKIIYFKKVLVTDPKTRKEVEGLRIYKIQ